MLDGVGQAADHMPGRFHGDHAQLQASALLNNAISRRGFIALPSLAAPMLGFAQGVASRVAVVIGNAAYADAPLPGAAKDAGAIASTLRSLGYDVLELRDGGKKQMLGTLAQAGTKLQGRSGVAVLYYAGHALQLNWQNFLMPVDAKVTTAEDVAGEAVNIQAALDAFRAARTRVNIFILDACRENPFGVAATGKGLAPIDAPPGTFLAYATAPGSVAVEGGTADGHGLYTRHFLEELKQPEAKIEDVFKRVRLRVRQASNGRQIPWESTSLEEDFVFSTGARVERESRVERERHFLQEMRDWEPVSGTENPADVFAFLQRYPNGAFAEQAQLRLDRLQRMQPVKPRYLVGDELLYDSEDAYGRNSRQLVLRVTAIEGDRVEINGGGMVWDVLGNLITDSEGQRLPAKVTVPAEIALGKKWRTEYFIGKRFYYYDFRVVAREEVEVPAGRFTALRIDGVGWTPVDDLGQRRQQTEEIWVDPATFVRVKWNWTRRSRNLIDGSARWSLRAMNRVPR
jgi:hypothetical protein